MREAWKRIWRLVTFGCIAFAWLRLRSGSVSPAVLLHASHDLFVQQNVDRLTVDPGRTRMVITEFGLGLAMGVALIWFWQHRGAALQAVLPAGRSGEAPPAAASAGAFP